MTWILVLLLVVTGVFFLTVGVGEWRILMKPGTQATFTAAKGRQSYIEEAVRSIIIGVILIIAGLIVWGISCFI